jgi:sugar/nucleoside kinase (ribokinase family)
MADFDLLVIGEINPDLILSGPDVTPVFGQAEKLVEAATLTIGSSSAITACGAARLGLRTAFVGVVGEDELGRFMLQAMSERGIDTSACIVDPGVATGLSVILSQQGDRAILTYPGAMTRLHIGHINRDTVSRARHLHVGSYFLLDALRPDLPALYAEARYLGLTTSLDSNWDPSERWDDGLAQLLPHCDVFLPNEAEARFISGRDDIVEAVDRLSAQVSTLVVKLGSRGGLACQDGVMVRVPSLAVDTVDTTGAGDSFNAGFLYGYLNHYSLEEAVRLACACGSLSTRAAGGTAAQPTLVEAMEVM